MAAGFKHISVTPAEEEDEVIVAGIGESDEGAGVSGPSPAREPSPAPAPEPVQAPPSGRPHASKSREDAYHETTLEDLEGEKMPLAQRIVIVAAIVCIIGALVYYFVAMR